jgi:hypothetical protein
MHEIIIGLFINRFEFGLMNFDKQIR